MTSGKTYHVGAVNGVPSGPFDAATLAEKISSGEITGQTLLWSKGMPAWAPCDTFPEFQPALAAAAAANTPPPMPEEVPPPMPASMGAPAMHPASAASRSDAPGAGFGRFHTGLPLTAAPATVPQATIWNPVSALIYNLKNYVKFDGRASRDEYWNYILAYYVVMAVLSLIPYIGLLFAFLILPLGLLLPTLGCTVRRLQDAGLPWVYILFALIPLAGPILLIVFCTKASQPANGFGACATPPMTVPQIQKLAFFNKRALFCSVGLAVIAVCLILKIVFFVISLNRAMHSIPYGAYPSYSSGYYSDTYSYY